MPPKDWGKRISQNVARKFLYLVAAIITLVIAGGFVVRIYEKELTEFAFVPTTKFEEQKAFATNKYDDPAMWFARGRWGGECNRLATGRRREDRSSGPAAIFFIHPTSYMEKTHWNAPLDDKLSQERAKLFLQGLASPFAASGEIWAPRYRQAAIGAFLTA
jgi:hypothetical protein